MSPNISSSVRGELSVDLMRWVTSPPFMGQPDRLPSLEIGEDIGHSMS